MLLRMAQSKTIKTHEYDSIVIGAGLSGLIAANQLESTGRKVALIEANLRKCQIAEGYTIDRRSALMRAAVFPGGPFDIVFLDPPYAQRTLEPWLDVAASHVAPDGLVVFEHASRVEAPTSREHLVLTRRVRQGDSALTFYVPGPAGMEI